MLISIFRLSLPSVLAVLTTLVFSPLVGAQSNQQANILLEVQQLRNEIAELRDMVERQQFELRRLKRSQEASQSAYAPVQTEHGGEISGENNEQTATLEAEPPAYRDIQPDEYNVQTSSQQFETREYSIGGQEPVVLPETEIEPQLETQDTEQEPDSDSYPPIEGRTITSPLPATNSESDGKPPVVDLSIGRESIEANTVENIEETQVIVEDRLGQSSVPTTSPAVNASTAGGIVPIPNSTTTVSRDGEEYREVVIQGDNNNLSERLAAQATDSPRALKDNREKEYYDQAFDYLKEYKYPEAIASFKQQIQLYPNGEWSDDAHYWIAESNYLNRNLTESKRYFRAIIDNFESSPRLPDAMLKTAYIEEEQGNQIEARILLQEIIQYYPRSDAANSAKNRLAKLTQ